MSPTTEKHFRFDHVLTALTAAILAWAVLAAVVVSSLAPLAKLPGLSGGAVPHARSAAPLLARAAPGAALDVDALLVCRAP
jgi:hypothetical protein